MAENKQYRRICVQRSGYANVPGDTDEEAIENAKKLREGDFDWESVAPDMIQDTAEVVEILGPDEM